MEKSLTESNKRSIWVWVIVVVAIIVSVIGGWFIWLKKSQPISKSSSDAVSEGNIGSWRELGSIISGNYADADIVELDDGRFRIYYSVEPEVPGNKFELYSAVSTNGEQWQTEEGIRKTMVSFPDVVKLDDGRFRLYFQNGGEIKSAISNEGLIFTDEPGIRVGKFESGFNLENVGAQSTIKMSNGSYLMVYRGMINQSYNAGEMLPNKNTQLFFYAVSDDGLTFEKRGLALDSRNQALLGLADGAEWVKWSNDQLRLYFWSYTGVYYITYKDNQFSNEPILDFTVKDNSGGRFPQNPACDPTLAKINGRWFLYYGIHTKGIHAAKYE